MFNSMILSQCYYKSLMSGQISTKQKTLVVEFFPIQTWNSKIGWTDAKKSFKDCATKIKNIKFEKKSFCCAKICLLDVVGSNFSLDWVSTVATWPGGVATLKWKRTFVCEKTWLDKI